MIILKRSFAITACIFILILALAACNFNKNNVGADNGGTTAGDENAEPNTSGNGMENVTEKETEPRFDYFAVESFAEYVRIDKSVCDNMEIELEDKYAAEDKHVDEYIEKLLFNKKTVKNNGAKVTNEPIRIGDTAYIFYRGEMLDEETGKYKEFDGGSNMKDNAPYALSIGSNSFIDGFEDGLVGIVPAETGPENMIKLNLKFPEDYHSSDIAGKDVVFYVYASWTVQYEIPEYTEDFIKNVVKFTPKGDDIVAEHREHIKSSIQAELDSAKAEAVEQKLWEVLFDKAEILKYPESEVEYFYNLYLTNLKDAMDYYFYYGYNFESIDVFARWYLGLDDNGDWQSVIRDEAKRAVAQTLIYHAAAEACGLELTEREFEVAIEKCIDAYKQSGKEYTREEILELVGETTIKEGVLYEKVVSYIKERATVIYK